MSESIKRIEERHPLPWEYRDYNNIGVVLDADERLVFFSSIKDNLNREETLRFLVSRANFMPEAVRLLKSADEKLLVLCHMCDNATSEAGYLVDCKNCNVESLDTSIKELLAKLEGGANE